jgi:hypothetical protein
MINTYTYKLLLQTNESTEWLEKKAAVVSLFDDDIGLRTVELTFNTFALEGEDFNNMLQLIHDTFSVYSMLIIGEHVGHIEAQKKGMPVALEVAVNLNGQEYRNIWSEEID